MKTLLFSIIIMFCTHLVSGQDILGTWKTIDDETGAEKSIVEIYEYEGKIYGKIVKILNPKKQDARCSKCKGKNQGRPILGLTIIEGLEKISDTYQGGTILNPENGKVYQCKLKLEKDKNTLRVRGYVAFFYKTQYWLRYPL